MNGARIVQQAFYAVLAVSALAVVMAGILVLVQEPRFQALVLHRVS